VSGDRPNELVDRAYQVGASAVATPDAAAAAATVDRRGTLRALGTIQIVLGGLTGLTAVGILAAAATRTDGMVMGPGLVCVVPAVNLLLTGIGSVRIARWSRRATLISAGIWLGLMLLAVASMFIDGRFGMGRESAVVTAIMLPPMLVALALPIVLLAVYTRPSVRATFERQAA